MNEDRLLELQAERAALDVAFDAHIKKFCAFMMEKPHRTAVILYNYAHDQEHIMRQISLNVHGHIRQRHNQYLLPNSSRIRFLLCVAEDDILGIRTFVPDFILVVQREWDKGNRGFGIRAAEEINIRAQLAKRERKTGRVLWTRY